eukprot:70826-Karenia_brevis.AAC.1
MGSHHAIVEFEKAARPHGIWLEWKRCSTRVTFANGATETLSGCVYVHFPTQPEIVTTTDAE